MSPPVPGISHFGDAGPLAHGHPPELPLQVGELLLDLGPLLAVLLHLALLAVLAVLLSRLVHALVDGVVDGVGLLVVLYGVQRYSTNASWQKREEPTDLLVGVLAEERAPVAGEVVVVGVVEVHLVVVVLLLLRRRRVAIVGDVGGLAGGPNVGPGGEAWWGWKVVYLLSLSESPLLVTHRWLLVQPRPRSPGAKACPGSASWPPGPR